jgi:hypothetical protein
MVIMIQLNSRSISHRDPMPALDTQLNARSADFQTNAAAGRHWSNLQPGWPSRSGQGSGADQHIAAKLPPRERMQMLLDGHAVFWSCRHWRLMGCMTTRRAVRWRHHQHWPGQRGGLHDCVQ